MVKMDIEKLFESLSNVEDRKPPEEKPVLGYLHSLIVLSTMSDSTPDITEVDFDTFTVADLEEYYEVAVDTVENIFPQVEKIIRDITGIKALQAPKMNFF